MYVCDEEIRSRKSSEVKKQQQHILKYEGSSHCNKEIYDKVNISSPTVQHPAARGGED